jgi:hypothetical protein
LQMKGSPDVSAQGASSTMQMAEAIIEKL